MAKSQQEYSNKICLEKLNAAMAEFNAPDGIIEVNRLRSCTAYVYLTQNYSILKSYDTIIAVIKRKSGYCYDLLRYNYHYTATSAQHIAKFHYDYGNYHNPRFTYRPIK